MNKKSHPFFVPDGDSRQDTAVLLVGTADEYGIDQRNIRAARGGFRISQSVADALGLDTSDEPEQAEPEPEEVSGNPETEPEPEPAKKSTRKKSTSKTNASGNRAGENEE